MFFAEENVKLLIHRGKHSRFFPKNRANSFSHASICAKTISSVLILGSLARPPDPSLAPPPLCGAVLRIPVPQLQERRDAAGQNQEDVEKARFHAVAEAWT